MPIDTPGSCEVALTVPFYDLDPMHMVWHGNYLKYFDFARSMLFRNAGIDLIDYYQRTGYLFPITKTTTKHINSLGYLDQFTCRATVVEARYKIVIDFQIQLNKNKRTFAKGRSEQVGVKYPEKEMLFEIPGEIRHKLGFGIGS